MGYLETGPWESIPTSELAEAAYPGLPTPAFPVHHCLILPLTFYQITLSPQSI